MHSPTSSLEPTELSYEQSNSPTLPSVPEFTDFDFHFGLILFSFSLNTYFPHLFSYVILDMTDEEAIRHCK